MEECGNCGYGNMYSVQSTYSHTGHLQVKFTYGNTDRWMDGKMD